MRTFYLFEVKDNIIRNYRNNYEELYDMLLNIHNLKSEDIVLGYNIFSSIVVPLNRESYNQYIKENNLDNENYICYNYTHTINDFYNDEATKMIINNSHIKIKTNKNAPSFFYNIRNFKNIFVCDFDNHDYFLLDNNILVA